MMRRYGNHSARRASDCGSGSMAGVVLILCIALSLTVLVAVGNGLICMNRARNTADAAALAAASAWNRGRSEPCLEAARIVASNGAQLLRCDMDGEDAWVDVAVRTMVAFIPPIEGRSRAGPEMCGAAFIEPAPSGHDLAVQAHVPAFTLGEATSGWGLLVW